jgi:transposase
MSANKLHADDTPVRVLAPGNGKTKTGRLWTYVRDDRPAGDTTPAAVWFAYTPDRKGEHPQAHLSKFTGTLQADGYAGFEQIYEAGRIKEAACWAHVRRRFYSAQIASRSGSAGAYRRTVCHRKKFAYARPNSDDEGRHQDRHYAASGRY